MNGLQKHLIVIIGTLLLTSVYYILAGKPTINDGKEYHAAANNLLEYNTLYAGNLNDTLDYRMYSKRTLGYPFYLVFQHLSAATTLISSIGLVLLNFFLGIQILSSLRTKKRGYVLFAFFFTVHIPLLLHITFPLSDLLLCTIISTSVLVFYDFKNTLHSKLISLGLLWGLGLLLKPVLLPTIIFSPIAYLYFRFNKDQSSIALLFPLIVFLVGSGINYTNTDQYEYSSISTINLGQYNAKLTIAKGYGYDSAQGYVSRPEFSIPQTATEYANYKSGVNTLAASTIFENIASYITVHIAGSLKMLVDPGRFELYTYFDEPTSDGSLTELIYAQKWDQLKTNLAKRPVLLVLFTFLFLLAIVKLFLAVFSIVKLKQLSFLLIITAYFVAIAGPVGAARFMLPVSVIYLVLVCQGAEVLLHFFQKSTKG
jgi:hypothetical protein